MKLGGARNARHYDASFPTERYQRLKSHALSEGVTINYVINRGVELAMQDAQQEAS